MDPTTHPDPTVPPSDTPSNNPDTREAAPATPPSGDDGIPPHVQAVLVAFDPSCDCPDMLEKLAEYAADVDMLAVCLVHLLDKVPRADGPERERAFKRVGRMAERIAHTAEAAAEYAEYAVEHVRGGKPDIDEEAPLVDEDDEEDDETEGE